MCIRDRYKMTSIVRLYMRLCCQVFYIMPVSYTHLDVYKRQVIKTRRVTAIFIIMVCYPRNARQAVSEYIDLSLIHI